VKGEKKGFGFGKQYQKSGGLFDGEFMDGKKSGKGKITF